MKKSKAFIFALILLNITIPVRIQANTQPISVTHTLTTLASFKDSSVTSPAINSVSLDSYLLNPGDSLTIKSMTELENKEQFPLSKPNHGWIYYQYTLIFTDDGDPNTPDRANFYNTNATYESIISQAGPRTISNISITYSFASKVTINYIDFSDSSTIHPSYSYYGRSAHYHEFLRAISQYSGDSISTHQLALLGFTYSHTNPSNLSANMVDDTYIINHYYSIVSTHNIIYNDGTGNGSIFSDETFTVNEGDSTPNFTGSTSRPGYTFTGWSPTVTPTVTKDQVYTAQWTQNAHTITYNDGSGNGSIFSDETFTVNEGDSTPNFTGSTSRPGYTFTGWSPTVTPTVTKDQVYTAQWTQNAHTITYNDGTGNGSIFSDETFTVNEGDSTPNFTGLTIRPGYTFTGWSPSVTPTVTKDQVYTAQWTQNAHTITYNDGTGNGSIFNDESFNVNEGYPTPNFTGSTPRSGYTFTGWSPLVTPTVTKDQVYTAQWTQNAHTITYNDETGNGSIFNDESFTVNEGYPTPNFTGSTLRPDYTFTGWSPLVTPTVTKDQVYTAQWTKIPLVAPITGKPTGDLIHIDTLLPVTGFNRNFEFPILMIACGLILIASKSLVKKRSKSLK